MAITAIDPASAEPAATFCQYSRVIRMAHGGRAPALRGNLTRAVGPPGPRAPEPSGCDEDERDPVAPTLIDDAVNAGCDEDERDLVAPTLIDDVRRARVAGRRRALFGHCSVQLC